MAAAYMLFKIYFLTFYSVLNIIMDIHARASHYATHQVQSEIYVLSGYKWLWYMHWLPITEHIKSNVKCMCFQAINGSGPPYLSELLCV